MILVEIPLVFLIMVTIKNLIIPRRVLITNGFIYLHGSGKLK